MKLIAQFGPLMRWFTRSVRCVSHTAKRLADGELGPLVRIVHMFDRVPSTAPDRDELARITQEQAALRRVATLVARGTPPPDVFKTVASEMGRLLEADCTAIRRYETEASVTVVGSWAESGDSELRMPVGLRLSVEGESVTSMVLRTGRPARMMTYRATPGEIGAWAREKGLDYAAGSPITVEGRLWGVMMAYWLSVEPPLQVEERMREFTELIATAIANAESRAELVASRARVVAAADAVRRGIERDLHDGTQQRLVTLGLVLRQAANGLSSGQPGLRKELEQSAHELSGIVDELREISRGLHPAIISRGGLAPALATLARRSVVPATCTVRVDRPLGEQIEVAVYYVVSEALTNAAKHAGASHIEIEVTAGDVVQLLIRDDGCGGAVTDRGSGLLGLKDRIEALGGSIRITSPAGEGTTLLTRIPVPLA